MEVFTVVGAMSTPIEIEELPAVGLRTAAAGLRTAAGEADDKS
jgi:hypothetical protein